MLFVVALFEKLIMSLDKGDIDDVLDNTLDDIEKVFHKGLFQKQPWKRVSWDPAARSGCFWNQPKFQMIALILSIFQCSGEMVDLILKKASNYNPKTIRSRSFERWDFHYFRF